jgi:hypothetical protein
MEDLHLQKEMLGEKKVKIKIILFLPLIIIALGDKSTMTKQKKQESVNEYGRKRITKSRFLSVGFFPNDKESSFVINKHRLIHHNISLEWN